MWEAMVFILTGICSNDPRQRQPHLSAQGPIPRSTPGQHPWGGFPQERRYPAGRDESGRFAQMPQGMHPSQWRGYAKTVDDSEDKGGLAPRGRPRRLRLGN